MGCRKERESIKGLWFPASFSSVSSCQQSELSDSAGALRQELYISVPTCQKVTMLLLQFGSQKHVSPQGCWSLDTWSWATPQPPPPPLAARRLIFPHPTQKKKPMAISTHSCWVDGSPQIIFHRRQLTDLSLAPLKDPEFVFESCEISTLLRIFAPIFFP